MFSFLWILGKNLGLVSKFFVFFAPVFEEFFLLYFS